MTTDPDAPLLAVLAAADEAEPRIERAASDGCMTPPRWKVDPPSDAERLEVGRICRDLDRVRAASVRHDVAGVIT